jgi:hypothetical protein
MGIFWLVFHIHTQSEFLSIHDYAHNLVDPQFSIHKNQFSIREWLEDRTSLKLNINSYNEIILIVIQQQKWHEYIHNLWNEFLSLKTTHFLPYKSLNSRFALTSASSSIWSTRWLKSSSSLWDKAMLKDCVSQSIVFPCTSEQVFLSPFKFGFSSKSIALVVRSINIRINVYTK